MNSTVKIPDALLTEARELAAREGTTVRALIAQGLRRIIGEPKRTGAFAHPPGPARHDLS